ncbi:BHLH domain-containing protein [Mycena indigotica]|uniref:BHLH domain-containing protein n=1 Tax=Mycena indigotica TaxID=2126181 RepID=A0A8H6T3P3_9AGAR|nr:BHLH domain-containing protein [Mycena indigotica]KAF7310290.1 BHLH domain-containing protein [Mycena indigotica]
MSSTACVAYLRRSTDDAMATNMDASPVSGDWLDRMPARRGAVFQISLIGCTLIPMAVPKNEKTARKRLCLIVPAHNTAGLAPTLGRGAIRLGSCIAGRLFLRDVAPWSHVFLPSYFPDGPRSRHCQFPFRILHPPTSLVALSTTTLPPATVDDARQRTRASATPTPLSHLSPHLALIRPPLIYAAAQSDGSPTYARCLCLTPPSPPRSFPLSAPPRTPCCLRIPLGISRPFSAPSSPPPPPLPSARPLEEEMSSTTTTSTLANLPAASLSSSPTTTTAIAPATGPTDATIPNPAAPIKRPRRRAPTAERRATHNAVERARRETLNGRFLALASLLPPLRVIRRPSKSAIVNSSIATVQAARRHRVLAAQTLKTMLRETEALRREVNEWRTRARIPTLDAPLRSETDNQALDMVLRGEVEELEVDLDVIGEFEEENENDEEEEGEENMMSNSYHEEDVKPPVNANDARFAFEMSPVSPMSAISGPMSAMAMGMPIPSPPSTRGSMSMPSPGASSDAGSWDGPRTPPSPVKAMYRNKPPTYNQEQYYQHQQQQVKGAGAAYDLGLDMGFEQQPQYAPASAQPGYNNAGAYGYDAFPAGAQSYNGFDGGWANVNPAHPAFYGVAGVAPGQYLHQPRAMGTF